MIIFESNEFSRRIAVQTILQATKAYYKDSNSSIEDVVFCLPNMEIVNIYKRELEHV